jgi:hypothetical protein
MTGDNNDYNEEEEEEGDNGSEVVGGEVGTGGVQTPDLPSLPPFG